jgi:hypothetical protein
MFHGNVPRIAVDICVPRGARRPVSAGQDTQQSRDVRRLQRVSGDTPWSRSTRVSQRLPEDTQQARPCVLARRVPRRDGPRGDLRHPHTARSRFETVPGKRLQPVGVARSQARDGPRRRHRTAGTQIVARNRRSLQLLLAVSRWRWRRHWARALSGSGRLEAFPGAVAQTISSDSRQPR